MDDLMERVRIENDFPELISEMLSSTDRVWYISRHAWDMFDDIINVEIEGRIRLGILTGLELLRYWTDEEARLDNDGIICSQPYLVIPEAWTMGFPNHAPPVVNICVAKDIDSFNPSLSVESRYIESNDFNWGAWKIDPLEFGEIEVKFYHGRDNDKAEEEKDEYDFGVWVCSLRNKNDQ